jgi:hypothetical protein
MRTLAAMLSVVAFTLSFGAIAAPQGMAPYPGQVSPYAAPQPPRLESNQPGPAPVAPPAANNAPKKDVGCLWTRRMSGWTPNGDEQMIIHQGRKRYLVTFSSRCREQRYEHAIRVTRNWGTCLRPGDRVEFTSPFGHRFPGHYMGSCIISKIELAPDQTAMR